jgi:hypothetical protein
MVTVTNEFMQEMRAKTREYSLVILKAGPNIRAVGAEKIIWEHGRRNFTLRADGLLQIVCPISDGSEVHGVGIFNAGIEETKKIMDDDPAVKTGIFVYETHPCHSIPGDCLS